MTNNQLIEALQDGFDQKSPTKDLNDILFNKEGDAKLIKTSLDFDSAVKAGFNQKNPPKQVVGVKFNAQGEKAVYNNPKELALAFNNGYIFDKIPEKDKYTPSMARGELIVLSNKILNNKATPNDLNQFELAVSTIVSQPKLVYNQENNSFETQKSILPSFVLNAIKKQKERDPTFPDFGLLDLEINAEPENQLDVLIGDFIFDKEVFGFGAAFDRGLSNGIEQLVELLETFTIGLVEIPAPKFAEKEKEAARIVKTLNAITITRALGSLAGRQNAELVKLIQSLQPTMGPFETRSTAIGKLKELKKQFQALINNADLLLKDQTLAQTDKAQLKKDKVDLGMLLNSYDKILQVIDKELPPLNVQDFRR